jgi:hypothetical protein
MYHGTGLSTGVSLTLTKYLFGTKVIFDFGVVFEVLLSEMFLIKVE